MQKPKNAASRPAPKAAKSAQGKVRVGNTNEVKLDKKNPIPFEVGSSAFLVQNGGRYIPFFQPLDNFAVTLLEARLLSVSQSGCVNTKKRYLVGKGIVITNLAEGKTADDLFKKFLKKVNGRNQSMRKILDKLWEAFLTFGNVPVEITRGKTAGKPWVYIYIKNFLECRLGWPPEGETESATMLYGKAFRKEGGFMTGDKVKEIPLYQVGRLNKADNWLKDGKVERTSIWLKNEVAGYDHYGLPSSVASLIYQILEYDAARFNKDNVDNNMVVDSAIFLTGNLSQEEADRIGSTMIRRHTGAGKRGRTSVYASEQNITDAKHIQFDTHKEGSYIETDGLCQAKIIFANEWDAVLAGLQSKDAMGKGGTYLKEIYEQKLKSLIIPMQEDMLTQFMEPVREIFQEWMGAKWEDYEFGIEALQIDNKTSEAATTVAGLNAFLDIITLVATGAYELEAAVWLVVARFGYTEADARKQLGTITKVDINVLPTSKRQTGNNNPQGGN